MFIEFVRITREFFVVDGLEVGQFGEEEANEVQV